MQSFVRFPQHAVEIRGLHIGFQLELLFPLQGSVRGVGESAQAEQFLFQPVAFRQLFRELPGDPAVSVQPGAEGRRFLPRRGGGPLTDGERLPDFGGIGRFPGGFGFQPTDRFRPGTACLGQPVPFLPLRRRILAAQKRDDRFFPGKAESGAVLLKSPG